MDAYARRAGIDGEEFDTFRRLVAAIDDEFRAMEAEKTQETD